MLLTDAANIDLVRYGTWQLKYNPLHVGLTGREMDYFEVRCTSENDVYDMCNYYPNLSLGPSEKSGMRVNCKDERCQCIGVRIVFTNYDAVGFNLAEIEIHIAGISLLIDW